MAKLNSVKYSNENEVAGYCDVLSAIHEGHSAFYLDEAPVLYIHRTMMSTSLAEEAVTKDGITSESPVE